MACGAGRKYDLEERLLRFTERLIDVVEALPATRVGSHIANQLTRCGTAPLANYGEAQGAVVAGRFRAQDEGLAQGTARGARLAVVDSAEEDGRIGPQPRPAARRVR